jgi:hypothetical protein
VTRACVPEFALDVSDDASLALALALADGSVSSDVGEDDDQDHDVEFEGDATPVVSSPHSAMALVHVAPTPPLPCTYCALLECDGDCDVYDDSGEFDMQDRADYLADMLDVDVCGSVLPTHITYSRTRHAPPKSVAKPRRSGALTAPEKTLRGAMWT